MLPVEFNALVESFRLQCPCSLDGGFRTMHHNFMIHGATDSWHLKALAADLIFDSEAELYKGASVAVSIFPGVELDLQNYHLHVDGRSGLPWHVVHQKDENGIWGFYDLAVFLDKSTQQV